MIYADRTKGTRVNGGKHDVECSTTGLVVPEGSPTTARPAEETVEPRVPYGEDVDKVSVV